MKRTLSILWASFALILAGANCQATDDYYWDGIMATVNGEAITMNDVYEMPGEISEEKKMAAQYKGEEATLHGHEVRAKYLNQLIEEKLIEQDFWAGGGWFPSGAADKRVDEIIRDRYQGNAAQFHKDLARDGETLDDLKASILHDYILNIMNRDMVEKKIVTTSATPPDVQRTQIRRAWLDSLRAKADIEMRPGW